MYCIQSLLCFLLQHQHSCELIRIWGVWSPAGSPELFKTLNGGGWWAVLWGYRVALVCKLHHYCPSLHLSACLKAPLCISASVAVATLDVFLTESSKTFISGGLFISLRPPSGGSQREVVRSHEGNWQRGTESVLMRQKTWVIQRRIRSPETMQHVWEGDCLISS